MTGKDFAVDRHTGTLEYLRTFIEVTVDVFRIHKRQFHRNRIQHRRQFVQLHVSARHHDLAIRTRRNALCRFAFAVFPNFVFHAEAGGIILGIAIDAFPLFLREIDSANREQNVLLLVNHLVCTREYTLQTGHPPFAALRFSFEHTHLITDLIIHRPHDVGRTGDIVSHIQKRIQQISLLCIMDRNLPDLRKQFRHIFLRGKLRFDRIQKLTQFFVFLRKRIERMSRNLFQFLCQGVLVLRCFSQCFLFAREGRRHFLFRVGDPLFLRCTVEQGGVQVTELLYFRQRHAFRHQPLLCLHDFRRFHFAEFSCEIGTHAFEVFPCADTL